jgi:hypothetical protein
MNGFETTGVRKRTEKGICIIKLGFSVNFGFVIICLFSLAE